MKNKNKLEMMFELLGNRGGVILDTFRMMDWAESEIERFRKEKGYEPSEAFMLCKPTDALYLNNEYPPTEQVYRAHCRELLNRYDDIRKGKKSMALDVATYAECLTVFHNLSLKMPLRHSAYEAVRMCFAQVFQGIETETTKKILEDYKHMGTETGKHRDWEVNEQLEEVRRAVSKVVGHRIEKKKVIQEAMQL